MMDYRENTTALHQERNKPWIFAPNIVLWIHLDKLEDSEGGSAVVTEHEADDAEKLCVEAAVAQTEQEAAEQRHTHTSHTHTQIKKRVSRQSEPSLFNLQLQRSAAVTKRLAGTRSRLSKEELEHFDFLHPATSDSSPQFCPSVSHILVTNLQLMRTNSSEIYMNSWSMIQYGCHITDSITFSIFLFFTQKLADVTKLQRHD